MVVNTNIPTPTPSAPKTLFDYYKSKGTALPSPSDRSKLFESSGLGKSALYVGDEAQNNLLLGHLISQDQSNKTPPSDSAAPPPERAALSSTGSNPDAGHPTAINAPNTADEFRKQIEPDGGRPQAPDYVDTYAKLRADQGITTIEDNINHLKAEKESLQANIATFRAKEAIGATSSGVFNARTSEEERNIQERVDAIDRNINIAQNNLDTKNNFISTMMTLTEKTYGEVKSNYESDLTKNISIQNAVDAQADKIQSGARANLTTINNMIANSGETWATMDPALKSQVAQLEMQAGFPAGTFESFARSKPKANVLATSVQADADGNQFVVIVNQDPNTGQISVTNMPTGGVKHYTTLTSEQRQAANDKAETHFETIAPNGGPVPASEYLKVRNDYPGDPTQFDKDESFRLSPADRKTLGIGKTTGTGVDLAGALKTIRKNATSTPQQ